MQASTTQPMPELFQARRTWPSSTKAFRSTGAFLVCPTHCPPTHSRSGSLPPFPLRPGSPCATHGISSKKFCEKLILQCSMAFSPCRHFHPHFVFNVTKTISSSSCLGSPRQATPPLSTTCAALFSISSSRQIIKASY